LVSQFPFSQDLQAHIICYVAFQILKHEKLEIAEEYLVKAALRRSAELEQQRREAMTKAARRQKIGKGNGERGAKAGREQEEEGRTG
jgi:hypothetical protein